VKTNLKDKITPEQTERILDRVVEGAKDSKLDEKIKELHREAMEAEGVTDPLDAILVTALANTVGGMARTATTAFPIPQSRQERISLAALRLARDIGALAAGPFGKRVLRDALEQEGVGSELVDSVLK
jgi:hypothetical protein